MNKVSTGILNGYLCLLILFFFNGCTGQRAGFDPQAPLPVASSQTESGEEAQQYRLQPGDMLELSLYTTPVPLDRLPGDNKKTAGFILGPGQTVAVKFVQAPELNETQVVRPDGTISLPYLGQFSVQGKTVLQAEQELKKFYSRELKKPDLYITLPHLNSILEELDRHHLDISVRSDGYISIPLLGDIRARGKTIDDLREEINTTLARRYPGISAALALKPGQTAAIFVTGEVQKPGRYPSVRSLSALQALALAGGKTPSAQNDILLVLRQKGNEIWTTQLDGNGLIEHEGRLEVFQLRPGDTLLVPAEHGQ